MTPSTKHRLDNKNFSTGNYLQNGVGFGWGRSCDELH